MSPTKIVELVKANAQVILDAHQRSWGIGGWYDAYSDTEDFVCKDPEEQIQAYGTYRRLYALLSKLSEQLAGDLKQ